jgi:hypothetical protein
VVTYAYGDAGTHYLPVDTEVAAGHSSRSQVDVRAVMARIGCITALYVMEEQRPIVSVVWGRADGAVFGLAGGTTAIFQESAAHVTVASAYSIPGRVLWFQQPTPPGERPRC